MKFFEPFYMISLIFVMISVIPIGASDEIFHFEMVLKNKSDFIRCAFMWQFAVYDLLNEELNTAGIVILEILTTVLVLPMNIVAFVSLCVCLFIKGICLLFYKIFQKREKQKPDISKTCNLLIDMMSEEPSEGFKWVDYRLWYFLQGYRLNKLPVDEVIEEWKKVCVEESKSESYLKKLRKHIIKDRKWQEKHKEEREVDK